MNALIIYDEKGKVWLIAHGVSDTPKELHCMRTDLPEGAAVERIDIADTENPIPVFFQERKEEVDLVEQIRKRVVAGENLRKVISGLKLSDEEKWELEKKVKEG